MSGQPALAIYIAFRPILRVAGRSGCLIPVLEPLSERKFGKQRFGCGS
jgi:hypothetical protein